MNNKLKKAISIFTATAAFTAALSLSAVSYADDSFEDDIYMSSFANYYTDGLPNGWVMPKYIVQNKTEVPCTGSDAHVYDEDGNKSVRIVTTLVNNTKEIIPFNKIVSGGKLHVSFDYKMPKNDDNTLGFITLFNAYNNPIYCDGATALSNYNGKDVTDFRGFTGLHTSQFLRIPYKVGSPLMISERCRFWDTLVETERTVNANQWYHFDIVIDIDNNFYDVWVDGESITANKQGKFDKDSNKNAFKGLGFVHTNGNTNANQGYYDNIFVTNYSDDDSVKLVTESLESDDVRVDVAFSEYLERAPENGDFLITNSYTGETVDYEVESGDGRHAILKINTDKAAKLNIAFSEESNLCGTISSRLSAKKASVFTNIKQGETVVPVLDEANAVDYNGNSVKLDGSEIVPIGTTTADISFSTPVNLDGIQDKVYIQKADSDEKLDVNYTVADDNKSVKMDFAELMSADSDYKLVISDTVSSYANENVFLPHSYEYSFRTSNDGGFGIFGDKITVDENAGTAVFSASIIKSDENAYKGTIIICGYSDEEVDGKVYSKLEKADVQKYDIETNSITAYETKPMDITGLKRIKCYITDADTHKLLLISEKEF